MSEHLQKWRLILGSKSEPQPEVALPGNDLQGMDAVLEALYESERQKGLGPSSPNINRWLGDIRKYFPTPVVQIMQKDALERLGLEQMLLEPELLATVEPDVNLVATILSLNKIIPSKTRATARMVVEKVVRSLEKKLRSPLREAILGSINRANRNRNPKLSEIDWHKTIRSNLKHYQPKYKTIIPQRLIGFGRRGQALKHVILLIDQSGSMATSVIYASIYAAIMASLRSIRTHLVIFDTQVVDLTEIIKDPVDILFGAQLGGGTDINQAVTYGESLISRPSDTILLLISDLYEGGNEMELVKRIGTIKAIGVQIICLLALNDEGAPIFNRSLAGKLAAMDVIAFACTPEQFPDLMAAAIVREDLTRFT